MKREIDNEQLTPDIIPVRGSGWLAIAAFAATFNAYSHWEEPWEHSDWSHGIPIPEYQEMVRRRGQQKVAQVAKSVRQTRDRTGVWDATLTELRTYLFRVWRCYHHMMTVPEDLGEVYDLLDAIRAKVGSSGPK